MLRSPQFWPVDGHVHFHRLERVGATLDAAASNFRAVLGGRAGWVHGSLLLVQSATERVFEQVRDASRIGNWTLTAARDEAESVVARCGATCLAVVCGRQVRADDGLEMLALGTTREFSEGLSFAQTMADVQRSGAVPVVPWGFGKWLGARGQRVAAVVASAGEPGLFVGDNGSRLGILGIPASIRAFEQLGLRLLPGTDPFPFGNDYRRVGGFGFMTGAAFDEAAPWRSLKEWLLKQSSSPTPYGRASGPVRFLTNQVGIHLYKAAQSGRCERA